MVEHSQVLLQDEDEAHDGVVPGSCNGQLEEEPPLARALGSRLVVMGPVALLLCAGAAVAALARPHSSSIVGAVAMISQLEDVPCTAFESEYCLNHRQSKSFGLPSIAACVQACFKDPACTGGYFYDGEKICYVFGVAEAKDSYCNPPMQANPDVHRFDCNRGTPQEATLRQDEPPPLTFAPAEQPHDAPAGEPPLPPGAAEQPPEAPTVVVEPVVVEPVVIEPLPLVAPATTPPVVEVVPAGNSNTCTGVAEVIGLGQVSIVSARWNTPKQIAGGVEVYGGGIVKASMRSRAYFANDCDPLGAVSGIRYSSIELLGKKFRYFVDLSGAECGCNAALYLTQMATNMDPGPCEDHYCDAGNVCGALCGEIDIQEGNKHAWFSTLHGARDRQGVGGGFGTQRHEWNATVYGPGAKCIDTTRAFQVTASFPMAANGLLEALQVTLEQPDMPCSLTTKTTEYPMPGGKDGMAEMTEVLRGGLTPIISYWGAGEDVDMSWMDGMKDGIGPACTDQAETCGEFAKFWGFRLDDILAEAVP